MSRSSFKAHAVDASGAVLTSASVTVRDQSGVVISPSALFTAYSGTGTHASNPFTATGGLISFYVEGSQVVTVSAVSGGTSQTWSNVVLNELIDTTNFATSSQGAKADTATQPADLGTAAATDSTDYATSAQGVLADSATQPADLGTAAAADLTTSAADGTAGRVLKVGDWGLGTATIQDFNADNVDETGFFRDISGGFNATYGGAWNVTHIRRLPNKQGAQFAIKEANSGTPKAAIRYSGFSGTWSTPVELWTTGNYQPETSLGLGVARKMKNKSGGAIADQAQVAGSSLKAVYTDSSGVEQESPATIGGTWINVSGMSLGNNEAAEFTKL